ncbi:MAG: flagellar hook-associated protein 3 [Gammaproteobacteria bacterium]|nr:flagellar hook-associated protein 3 [Gammaproteobacteria bacterium]|tara:strand:+ start:420 stop:1340 length:921 start_codon:yes stop_codon:yes gene_type:complete
MRISTNLYFSTLNQRLAEQQNEIANLQTQLASGKKAATASMDSEAAMAGLRMNSILQEQSDHKFSLQGADNRLRQEESLVAAMQKISDRIQELSITAASDTYSAEDRKMIASEVAQYKEQLLSYANGQDESGNYMFSGGASRTKPFVLNADGSVTYSGDQTSINFDIGGGEKIRVNSIGSNVIGNITRTNADDSTSQITAFDIIDDLVTALNGNNQTNISRAMTEAESLSSSLVKKQVELGISQNRISNRLDIIEEKTILYKDILSKTVDTDYTEAITKLSANMLALEAAQSTFAKVSQLSLFDYI